MSQNNNSEQLSARLRPDVECAPWVIDEVRKLEARATLSAGVIDPANNVWMFKDREGKWCPFSSDQHRENTIASGDWEVRMFSTSPTSSDALLAAVDAAFELEIPRVSTLEYNSNEICRWFFGEFRKSLAGMIDVSDAANEVIAIYRDGDIDALAQEIRRVDGEHKLGAGALAEALMPFLAGRRGTPAAEWRERGEPDPHGNYYNGERAALAYGHYTDDELANAVFLCDHRRSFDSIGYLTAAKDRIRWLSRALVAATSKGSEALAPIGELIRTQDNRITDQPLFVVEQKRRICGVEEDFSDGRMWYDARNVESYDDAGKLERDADRAAEGSPPIDWQVGYYKETWEFVTACFTEQGCKDYLARDGHNLREPRIYAYGSYRNAEWQAVRNYLKSLPAPAAAEAKQS